MIQILFPAKKLFTIVSGKKFFFFLFPVFFIASKSFAQTDRNDLFQSDFVKVSSGMLQGVSDPETGLKYFWGIPYAQPPVGNLRWRAPQVVIPWTGVRKANHFGPKAMQLNIFSDMRFRSKETSEDCLYLNVWTPAQTPNDLLPVFVYFYGGGFVAGDGSEWRYDGADMAQKGIVTVTVNYRLGIFGFFAHPGLTKESTHHSSGNYGMLDQQAALQWVHDNIHAFGGDPNRVTIGGESAGSIAVFALMASPLSRNFIAGAIGESGAMIQPTLPPISLSEGEKRGVEFAKKIGDTSLQSLRNLPAEELLKLGSQKGFSYFTSTIDGYFFPESPLEIFEKGEQAKIPLLAGWNSAEAPYTSFMQGQIPTPENYKKLVQKQFGGKAQEVLKLFPGNNQAQVIQSATDLASDQFIVYSTWKWTELQRNTSGKNVYRYLFERPRPNGYKGFGNGSDHPLPPPVNGAAHSWEIEYALGNLATNKVYPWTPDDYKVSATMLDYFANFIKTGNPNGNGLPDWAPNNAGTSVKVMHINVDSRLLPENDRKQFEFLDKYYLGK